MLCKLVLNRFVQVRVREGGGGGGEGIKIFKAVSNIVLKHESPTGVYKGSSLRHKIGYALFPYSLNP